MKKVLGFVLFGLLSVSPLFAQGILKVQNVTAPAGRIVNVDVTIEGAPKIGGARVTLDFQQVTPAGQPALTVAGPASLGSVFRDPRDVVDSEVRDGQVDVLVVSPTVADGTGSLFTVPFALSGGAREGTAYQIRVINFELIGGDNQPIAGIQAQGGTLTVGPSTTPVLTVSDSVGAPGSTVLVNVTLGDIPSIGALKVTLVHTGLTAGKAILGPLFAPPTLAEIETDTEVAGQTSVIIVTPGEVKGPGVAFSLPLTIPAPAKAGDQFLLQLSQVEVIDGQNRPVLVAGVAGTLTVVPANAPVVAVQDVTAQPGETVNVAVTIGDVKRIGGVRATLSINGLTAGQAQKGPIFTQPDDIIETDTSVVGEVSVAVITKTSADGPGTLFTVPLTVPATTQPGTVITLALTNLELIDADNRPIVIQGKDGTLTVAGPVRAVLRIASVSGQPGQTIKVPVTINEVKRIGAVRVAIDLGGLTAQPATLEGSIFREEEGDLIDSDLETPGQIQVVAVTKDSRDGPGVLFQLPVTIPANARPGQNFTLSFISFEAIDADNRPIVIAEAVNGVVTVVVGPVPDVQVDTIDVPVGTIRTDVVVRLNNEVKGIGGLDFTLTLGRLALAGVPSLEGTIFRAAPERQIADAEDIGGGRARVVVVTAESADGPGILFRLPVNLPADAKAGDEFPIEITGTMIDANNNEIAGIVFRPGRIRVFQVQPVTFSLVVNPVEGPPGTEVQARVDVSGPAVALGAVRLRLEAPQFERVGDVSTLVQTGQQQVVEAEDVSPGVMDVAFVTAGSFNVPAQGVFVIPLRVRADALAGVVSLSITQIEAIDANNRSVPVVGQGATFTIGPVVPPFRNTRPPVLGVVVSPERGLPGSEFEASVRVTNDADNLGAVKLVVSAEGMEVVSAGTGLPVGEPNQVFDFEAEPGRVRLAYVTTGVFNGPAEVFRVRFRVPEGALPRVVSVTVSEVEVVDGTNAVVVPAAVTGASFEVLPVPPVVVPPVLGVVAEPAQGRPGDVVTVRVRIANEARGLGALRATVVLPPVLERRLTEAVTSPLVRDPQRDLFEYEDVVEQNQVKVVFVTTGSFGGPGVVAEVPVRVKADAPPGVVQIRLSEVEVIDEGNRPVVPQEVQVGTFEVLPPVVPPFRNTRPPVLGVVVSPERGLPGSEFEASVRVTNDADNLGAVKLVVSAEGMEVVSAGTGLPVGEPNQVFDFEAEPGRVRLAYVTTGVFNGPAEVFRVRFRVPEGALPRVVSVTVSEVEVVDGTNAVVVPAAVTGASFEVLPKVVPPAFRGEGRIAIANGVLALGATQGVVNLRGISLKNLSAIDLTLRFDPQVFVPRKDAQGEVIVTPGPQAGPGAVASAEEVAPGQLRIAIVSPTTFAEGSGLLATLEVEPPQGQRFQAFRFSNVTPVSARALDDQNIEGDFLTNILPGLLIVGAESKPGQGWVFQSDVPITSAPSLAVVNNRAVVMFGTSDGRLIVRTAKENDPAFEGGTRDTVNVGGGAIVGRPTVRDGGIYLSTEGGTVAFIDAVGGNVRWRAQLQAQGLTAPVVIADAAGKRWVFVGDNQGRLHKLDADTGQPAQGSPAPVARGAILTSPAAGEVAPGVRDIWVADAQGFLTGVNLENLTVKQQFQFQGPLSSAPFITSQIFSPSAQVVDRLVALGTSGDGVFVMVNPRTLQAVLTVPTESSIVGPIFIDTDANFVPTFGYVAGINRAGGSSRLVRVNLGGLDPAKVNDPAGRLEVIASDLEGEAREAVLAWAKAGFTTYAYVLTSLADGTGRFYGLEARAGGSRVVVNLTGRPFSPSIDPLNNLVFVAFTDAQGGMLVGLPVLP